MARVASLLFFALDVASARVVRSAEAESEASNDSVAPVMPVRALRAVGCASLPRRVPPAQMSVTDAFQILGLEVGASAAEIRRAFRARATALHPDVSLDPDAAVKFQELVLARAEIEAGHTDGSRTIGLSRDPKYDPPAGLSDTERLAWLIDQNKVILFARGTKQEPLDDDSSDAVALLSFIAFNTKTRFAAVDVSQDPGLRAALEQRGVHRVPVLFIDRENQGGVEQISALYDAGALNAMFGGEQLVSPKELSEWAGRSAGKKRRPQRNLVFGNLEWYVQHEDGIWRAEQPDDDEQQQAADAEPSALGTSEDGPSGAGDDACEQPADRIEDVLEYRHVWGQPQWQVRWQSDEVSWEVYDVLKGYALPELVETAKSMETSATNSAR